MRSLRTLALQTSLATAIFAVSGCHTQSGYLPPEAPMPGNTVLLSQMMRELSAQPGFTEAMLAQLDKGEKKGPALLTPKLVDDLRSRILGKDWAGLDRFPGWTMREINPTVRVIGHEAGKDQTLEETSAVHPGAPLGTQQTATYLDLGTYGLEKTNTIFLDQPSTLAPFTTNGIVTTLGDGVVRGDGPNALATEHADSQRLADVLNRLAANQLDGARHAVAELATGKGVALSTPEDLVDALAASGNTVTVQDARYFANFGHFHYNGQDVMMPFWINTGIIIPNTEGVFSRGRRLLIPVSHAELEWHIHGPRINADVSYYFGIDGKSEWRTMDTLDQAWVLKRNAHTYTGAQAVEATRLAGLLTVAYMHLHAAHPKLPFGGYYGLGVCQDGVSAIEKKLTGKATLYPNTADTSFFNDSRDTEVNQMIGAIPKDRTGAAPEPERVFGSLPADPGVNGDFAAITIPGLALDLQASYFAWQHGSLKSNRHKVNMPLLIVLLAALILIVGAITRRRNMHAYR